MAISSVVITLTPEKSDETQAEIARDPHVELGEPCGLQIPAVIEAADGRSSRDVWHRLQNLPGVAQLSLAAVFHDDLVNEDDGE